MSDASDAPTAPVDSAVSVAPVSTADRVRVPVAIDVPPTEVELFADRLFAAGASAVAERVADDGLVTLIADLDVDAIDQWNQHDARSSRVSSQSTQAQSHLEGETQASLTLRTLEPDAAWNDGWRKFASVRRCGRIVIRPSWLPAGSPIRSDLPEGRGARELVGGPVDEVVELVMEPGTSFGSGSHVTTRLCVEVISKRLSAGDPPSRVLDVGCGTGVLGVAAALLGAGSITAIDIDSEAIEVTRGLADLNGVSSKVDASGTSLAEVEGYFDLVLANVLIPVFEELGAEMVARVRPGGALVASGLLVEHQARVEAALDGLQLMSVGGRDGWLVLEFTKPTS